MMDAELRAAVRERAGERCEYCQRRQADSPLIPLQIEHVVPRKHGGSDQLENLALACAECNLHKGSNLTGIDPESGRAAVYVGEAESIRDRVKGHLDKDYWNHIAFFTSKDENLTKAHIRYLEGRLIEQAKQAGRADVKNSQASSSRLPESDREDMEIFLEKIHQLMAALGVEVLVPTAIHATAVTERETLTCEIKGLKATGRLTPNGMVVLAGSQAVLNVRPSSQKYPWPVNMRQRLRDDGALEVRPDCLFFVRDVEFTSPSAAAAVIHGGHANGLISWKNKQGKTLKELESVQT